jgi:hypothetical protein
MDESTLKHTLFFDNAFERSCSPSKPIWLSRRFRVVSVYIKTRYEIDQHGVDRTWLFSNLIAKYCAPKEPILFPWRSSVVSVWKIHHSLKLMLNICFISPDSFVMHQLNTLLLEDRSHSIEDLTSLESALNNKRRWRLIKYKKTNITLLVCNKLAKYCAPSGPILLHLRMSVVSVWINMEMIDLYQTMYELVLRDFSVMH